MVNPSPFVVDRNAGHSAATAQISGAAVWSAAMDVGGWLRGLGLGKYEAAFLDNGIGGAVLPHLTVEDLKEIGVATVGDRRMLLAAIAALATPRSSEPIGPQPSPALPAKAPELSAERRPITVMFCDLVGSTSIAAKLDPEDWRNLVNAYLDEASAAITNLGGHVLKRLGDGLMALFGYPQAQENDAERAVRAGLAIQRALADIKARNVAKGAPELSARIGLESGPVVVEAAGEVFGDAPNVAARVQGLAEPGSVLITMNVQRQVAGLFVVEEQGARELGCRRAGPTLPHRARERWRPAGAGAGFNALCRPRGGTRPLNTPLGARAGGRRPACADRGRAGAGQVEAR
jgi:class 3 adenylate cyclase